MLMFWSSVKCAATTARNLARNSTTPDPLSTRLSERWVEDTTPLRPAGWRAVGGGKGVEERTLAAAAACTAAAASALLVDRLRAENKYGVAVQRHTRLEHVHLEQAVVSCSAKAGHYYALMMDEHGGIIEADNTYRAIAMFQTTLG